MPGGGDVGQNQRFAALKSATQALSCLSEPKSWEDLVTECDAVEGLTTVQRHRTKNAFRVLKSVFGDEFIAKLYGGEMGHPIMSTLFNRAPWTRLVLCEMASDVQRVSAVTNGKNLVRRLKDKKTYAEARHVLRHASRFVATGFDVAIDPKIGVKGKPKVPDLVISLPKYSDRIYVELTALGRSGGEARATDVFRTVSEPLMFCDLPYAGRLNRLVSLRHAQELALRVKETLEQAKRHRSFEELVVPNTLDVAIAPPEASEAFGDWCRERGLAPNSFSGPHYDVNEIARTTASIVKKQRQLPPEYPGIVVVRGRVLLQEQNLAELAQAVEGRIGDFSNVLGVLIEGGYLGGGEGVVRTAVGPHSYMKFIKEDGLRTEQRLFVLNRYCEQKITMATVTKVYEAFDLA